MFLKLRPDYAKNDALNIVLIAVILKFLILKKSLFASVDQ